MEKLRADDQIDQATRIRWSVKPGLSENQQRALETIQDTQVKAIDDARFAVFETKVNDNNDIPQAQHNAKDFEKSSIEFQEGVDENKSLIDWILSK